MYKYIKTIYYYYILQYFIYNKQQINFLLSKIHTSCFNICTKDSYKKLWQFTYINGYIHKWFILLSQFLYNAVIKHLLQIQRPMCNVTLPIMKLQIVSILFSSYYLKWTQNCHLLELKCADSLCIRKCVLKFFVIHIRFRNKYFFTVTLYSNIK